MSYAPRKTPSMSMPQTLRLHLPVAALDLAERLLQEYCLRAEHDDAVDPIDTHAPMRLGTNRVASRTCRLDPELDWQLFIDAVYKQRLAIIYRDRDTMAWMVAVWRLHSR